VNNFRKKLEIYPYLLTETLRRGNQPKLPDLLIPLINWEGASRFSRFFTSCGSSWTVDLLTYLGINIEVKLKRNFCQSITVNLSL